MADITPEELKEIAKVAETLEELENTLTQITLGSVRIFDASAGSDLGALVSSDDARIFSPDKI